MLYSQKDRMFVDGMFAARFPNIKPNARILLHDIEVPQRPYTGTWVSRSWTLGSAISAGFNRGRLGHKRSSRFHTSRTTAARSRFVILNPQFKIMDFESFCKQSILFALYERDKCRAALTVVAGMAVGITIIRPWRLGLMSWFWF